MRIEAEEKGKVCHRRDIDNHGDKAVDVDVGDVLEFNRQRHPVAVAPRKLILL